nr:hypothetical protein [Polaromonas sp. CG_9.11]
MPDDADLDRTNATCRDGMLRATVPRGEDSTPRQSNAN